MKNNGRQRFYLWDYLWWMGEKWKQARRTGRVDGEMMLSIYIFALLIFPMMTVTIRLFPGVSALLPCVVFSIVTFAVMSLVSRIYKWRGKAVMSHYAKCRFNGIMWLFKEVLLYWRRKTGWGILWINRYPFWSMGMIPWMRNSRRRRLRLIGTCWSWRFH